MLRIYNSVSKLPDHAYEALKRAGDSDFFMSPDWFALLEDTVLQPGDNPCYAILEEDHRTLALLPLVRWSGKPAVLSSFTTFYTLSYAPILAPLNPAELNSALSRLGGELMRITAGVDLKMLLPDDTTTDLLKAAFALCGGVPVQYMSHKNWIHKLDSSDRASYMTQRPSRLLSTLKRKKTKLDREHRWEIRLYTTEADLEEGISAYEAIYERSWKGREQFTHFMPRLMRLAARHGALRLAVCIVDGIPAASQFWIVHGNTATIYKLAYDENYKRFSVGSILSEFLFRHVMEESKVSVIDYGVGDELYKRDWMSICRDRVGLRVFNPRTMNGLLSLTRHRMGRLARSLIQRPSS